MVPAASATIDPGTFAEMRAIATMITSVPAASATAGGDHVDRCAASARILGMKSPGTASRRSPSRSRICVLAIRIAIPLVKPTTTGRGMNRTADPIPVTPSATSSPPAISVHMNRPSTPCAATMPATMTTKAPVGPPIWTRDPPSAEMIVPATMAV